MKLFYSLKYQIALTIFVIQLVIIAVLLWQTQSSAFKEVQRIMRIQDTSVLQVLSSVSESSLFNENYFDIQPYFLQAIETDHVLSAHLTDYRELVVVSSDKAILGESNVKKVDDAVSYWLKTPFENNGEKIGELNVEFSLQEIEHAYKNSLQQAYFLGLIGVFITALLSILIGHVLTKRLVSLRLRAEQFADGSSESIDVLSGNDELSDLSHSLNAMAIQLNKSMKEIEHLAFHDPLTGLANRREFDKRLVTAFNMAKEHGHFYALLYLDLDKFKLVNDACGHQAGDQLLIQLSAQMLDVIRQRDTLVRFGGDEFGVLLESCSLAQASEVAQKLLTKVYSFKFFWEGKMMQVGVSIGVAALNFKTPNVEQVMSSADAACYTAKKKGRNQVHIVTPGDAIVEGHFSDIDWINRLSKMIENDSFSMAYQEINSLKEPSDIVRMEFLLRMKDGKDGWVSPSLFIDAAERFDFIQRLDRYVVDKVFRLIATNKLPEKNIMCFINLSGKSMSDERLFDYVSNKLIEYDLNAKQICFEITETAAIANFNHASVFIEKARALGCSFALDDFGSGMCSFSYLKSFQVDYVKIDGSFILSMQQNPLDKTIVKSINKISHASGFKTIAEFVETDSILEQVKALNIDFAQGYGLHKPEIIKES